MAWQYPVHGHVHGLAYVSGNVSIDMYIGMYTDCCTGDNDVATKRSTVCEDELANMCLPMYG